MQRIERYGVIALVLLLVTIAAVSFWDDGGTPSDNDKTDANQERIAKQRKSSQVVAQKPDNVRVGRQELPVTAPSTANANVDPNVALREAGAASEAARQKNLPRKSTKPTFQTLPAKVVEEQSSLAERGFDRDETGTAYRKGSSAADTREVEFPDSLTSGAQPSTSPRNETPYVPLAEAERAAKADKSRTLSAAGNGDATRARTYTVQAGDSLSRIAERTLGSSKRWPEIQSMNGGVDPARLLVGQVLRLPGDGPSVASSLKPVITDTSKEIPPRSADGVYYTVKPGDSLSMIAEDFLGKSSRWKEIIELNPGVKPEALYVGKRLRMPSGPVLQKPSVALASAKPVSSTSKKSKVR